MWACGIIMYILLEGKHPLYEPGIDDEKSYIKKLLNPKWILSKSFTSLAKDLFFKLCNNMPIERYTSDKAIKHPWITRDFSAPIPMT